MSSLLKTFAVTAAAGLALSSVTAQAGTRAESSPVVVDIQRGAEGTVDADSLKGFSAAWLLLLVAALAALVVLLADGRTRGG